MKTSACESVDSDALRNALLVLAVTKTQSFAIAELEIALKYENISILYAYNLKKDVEQLYIF